MSDAFTIYEEQKLLETTKDLMDFENAPTLPAPSLTPTNLFTFGGLFGVDKEQAGTYSKETAVNPSAPGPSTTPTNLFRNSNSSGPAKEKVGTSNTGTAGIPAKRHQSTYGNHTPVGSRGPTPHGNVQHGRNATRPACLMHHRMSCYQCNSYVNKKWYSNPAQHRLTHRPRFYYTTGDPLFDEFNRRYGTRIPKREFLLLVARALSGEFR